ncbi:MULTISPECIES: lipopolysaccharide biosynthesis protein [Rhizobium]|uniref:Lipopolysaccharide biosynthesis protein n=1 Tax=Rhizobium anhuiense TaxID=1184720 RepID=A0A3S0SDZ6_9HYPH|nr:MULTISPECIES: lipopolysaccharide biosynthesis protein [Rhizobium]KZS50225.1 lipopolysaccharide biosynthesis protein [Rhizobium anhuiense bv. trifolii]MBB3298237.1 O-antigen/teichoic acid export membrane protein [Rhizobium sp. BK112]MBB3367855.1 O-antigen/teichoic acid export membrane protein [Rhizobium sp. BK077]MBB4117646.1 O-antigen/teichoic acid export membrane protein [Rhizobium sp. BK226]MBB4178129.1 O-antigen/teichoic acid export membrane protein [Rhizobium sp. BK109]
MSVLRDDDILFSHVSENRSAAAVTGAFWSALSTLIPTVLTFAVFVVTSRVLQPQDFGLVALAFSIVSFAGSFGPTAFGEAIIQKAEIRRSHLDTIFLLSLAFSFLIYGALCIAASPIAAYVGHEQITPLIYIMGLKVFFDFTAVVPNAIVNRKMSFHLVAVRTVIATITSACICLVLVLAGFGLWGLAIAQIAATAASCGAAFWGAGWRPGLHLKRASLNELLHYGFFASGTRFLQTMSLDNLLIGVLLSPSALGIYNFSKRLFDMINNVIAGGLTSVTHVLLSSLRADPKKVREAFLMATFGCALVSYPVFIGLAAVADDAITTIFGAHWIAAVWPVRFYCVIGLMAGIGYVQASLIKSQGEMDWWFYYQLARNLLTLLTIAILYPYGVTTIVFAIMIEVLLFWPITSWKVSQHIELSIPAYLAQFLRPTMASAGMVAVIFLLHELLIHWSPYPRLAVEILAGGMAYCGLIFVLCRARLNVLIGSIKQARQRKSNRGAVANPA